MTPLLEAAGLAKSFGGVAAVRGVDLRVQAGEIVALIGPNGAGKSTLFGMLSGQLRPDAGAVRLAGRDVTGWPPRRVAQVGVARTFQVAAAFGSMTVRENVGTACLIRAGRAWRPFGRAGRAGRGSATAEAEALLDRVGLLADADRPAAALAYGDVKRLELAMALAGRPRLLLMDEPTAGMAPGERGAAMRAAAEGARRDGVGLLFTEHDMGVVFAHADRVLVLSRGWIIAEGPPAAVRRDPEVRAVYLGQEAGSSG